MTGTNSSEATDSGGGTGSGTGSNTSNTSNTSGTDTATSGPRTVRGQFTCDVQSEANGQAANATGQVLNFQDDGHVTGFGGEVAQALKTDRLPYQVMGSNVEMTIQAYAVVVTLGTTWTDDNSVKATKSGCRVVPGGISIFGAFACQTLTRLEFSCRR